MLGRPDGGPPKVRTTKLQVRGPEPSVCVLPNSKCMVQSWIRCVRQHTKCVRLHTKCVRPTWLTGTSTYEETKLTYRDESRAGSIRPRTSGALPPMVEQHRTVNGGTVDSREAHPTEALKLL